MSLWRKGLGAGLIPASLRNVRKLRSGRIPSREWRWGRGSGDCASTPLPASYRAKPRFRSTAPSARPEMTMTKPRNPTRDDAGLAPRPQETEERAMALDLPPADLSEAMQAAFAK